MDNPEYSIVIPVYNSQFTLDELYVRIKIVFEDITENYELILVDDCSTDLSWEKMKYLRRMDKRVKIIHLLRNFGQHNAILGGFNYSNGDNIIVLDDDLQNPPEEIPKLIEKAKEGYMVVYGAYKVKCHSTWENLLSKCFQTLMHNILKIPKEVYISNFLICKSSVIKNAIKIKSSLPFLAAAIIKNAPLNKITSTEVMHMPRKAGKSNYNFIKLFKLGLNLFINYSALPLILLSTLGFILSILSIIYGTTIVIRKLMDSDYSLMGWNSLMFAVVFLGGFILIALGIIGEYLRRILMDVSYQEQYIIEEMDL